MCEKLAILADTYGMLPSMEFEKQRLADQTTLKGREFLVARSVEVWVPLGKKDAPRD